MKISIIGASGNVGSCAAFYITAQGLADEIILIDDPRPDMVAIHAIDLDTAATGLDEHVRAGSYPEMKDSDIVVIAAGSAKVFKSRLEVLPENLPIIRGFAGEIDKYCPRAVVITATNPVDPLNYAMYLALETDRRRVIGYSANDSIRFRQRLADTLGVASSRIRASVIGEHGNSQVLLFSSVRVDGQPVMLDETIRQKLYQMIPDAQAVLEDLREKTGRTTAWTTAVGLASVCRAIANNTGEMIPCSVVLEGEYGYSGLGMSVPVTLGSEGVREIQEWTLEPDEKAALERSVSTLRPAAMYVEDYFGLKQ